MFPAVEEKQSVPVKQPSDHSAGAEFGANAPRKRRCAGPVWQLPPALTVFIQLEQGNQQSAFEELADSPRLTRPEQHGSGEE